MILKNKKNGKDKTPEKFCLSENAVVFIKKFVLSELNIATPINEGVFRPHNRFSNTMGNRYDRSVK